MKSLIVLLVVFYSMRSLAAGPVVELKVQAPMKVTSVSEGDYELPDYAMTSWYVYLPVPVFKIKSYRILVDLTAQNGKMDFKKDFSLKSKFENRGYTAVGVGSFPLKEEGDFQVFAFYRRISGIAFSRGSGANEFNLGARLNKSPISYLSQAARYPMYFGLRLRRYTNFTRLLPYFIQYLEWGNSTLVIDLPTTITFQHTLWLYHVFSLGVLLDDTMISPYDLGGGARGWISNSLGANVFVGYTYFITSDLSFTLRVGIRGEQNQYINDDGTLDFSYATDASPIFMSTLNYSP